MKYGKLQAVLYDCCDDQAIVMAKSFLNQLLVTASLIAGNWLTLTIVTVDDRYFVKNA